MLSSSLKVSLVLIAMLVTPARAQVMPDTVAARVAYENCSTQVAKRLATGPDAADVIAKAATYACEPQMKALAAIFKREEKGGIPMVFMAETNDNLVKKLILTILESRAKK